MASQKYANLAQSTLDGAYTAADPTLTVITGEGALFPSSGDFTVAIDDPPAFFLKCTSRASDVLTVSTSGQEGSTAVNKTAGTKVTQVITAGVLDAIRGDLSGIGAYASLPGTARLGDRWKCTDCPLEFIYNGSAWKAFWSGFPVTLLPTVASLTWVNQGASTATDSFGSIYLSVPSSGTNTVRQLVEAMPGGSWSLTIAMLLDSVNADHVTSGIILRDSGTSRLIVWGPSRFSGGLYCGVYYYNSSTSFGSAASTRTFITAPRWFRVTDDTTNFTFYYSHDGVNWVQQYQVSRTAHLATPNQIGIGMDALNSAAGYGTFYHYVKA